MRVSKRQLRRIIREERRKLLEQHDPLDPFDPEAYQSPEHGGDVPVPAANVETLWGEVEGALNSLTTVLSKLEGIDPQASSDAAAYVAEEIHSWK